MQVARGRLEGKGSELRTKTFTGKVWLDPMVAAEGLLLNNVFFEPGARTFWHRHAGGQILMVSQGHGYVVTREGEQASVRGGDVVHSPAGEVHWHGADADTFMLHLSVSLGATEWLEEVSAEEYAAVLRDLHGL
jgi:quercetin dioxygenase-like cupin family protein